MCPWKLRPVHLRPPALLPPIFSHVHRFQPVGSQPLHKSTVSRHYVRQCTVLMLSTFYWVLNKNAEENRKIYFKKSQNNRKTKMKEWRGAEQEVVWTRKVKPTSGSCSCNFCFSTSSFFHTNCICPVHPVHPVWPAFSVLPSSGDFSNFPIKLIWLPTVNLFFLIRGAKRHPKDDRNGRSGFSDLLLTGAGPHPMWSESSECPQMSHHSQQILLWSDFSFSVVIFCYLQRHTFWFLRLCTWAFYNSFLL